MSVSCVNGRNVGGLTPDQTENLGKKVASNVESAQAKLMSVMDKGSKSEVFAAQAAYDHAKEMYSLLLNLLKSGHDTVMEAIRNISR